MSSKSIHFSNYLWLFNVVFLAPIIEEIIFRGIILRGLLTSYTPIKAILISSVVFGLIHFNVQQIPQAIVSGIYLGFVFYKTKSLSAVIILHSIANLLSLLSLFFHYEYGNTDIHSINDIYGYLSVYIILPCLFLFSYTLYIIIKK